MGLQRVEPNEHPSSYVLTNVSILYNSPFLFLASRQISVKVVGDQSMLSPQLRMTLICCLLSQVY